MAGAFNEVFFVTNSLTVISSAKNLLMQGRPKRKKQMLSNAMKKTIFRMLNKWTMMDLKTFSEFGEVDSANVLGSFLKLAQVRLKDIDSVTPALRLKWGIGMTELFALT